MKRKALCFILTLLAIAVFSLGCGSSGSSNSVAPAPTTMTSVKVSLTQNGKAVNGADVALYTPAAAMREGLNQAQNTTLRANVGNTNTQGVYTPASTSDEGIYTFKVPAGEYTLIANKGNSKAVVTSLRAATAEGDSITNVNTELQPTGTITGTVATGSAQIVTGAIVYLENTSCVTFAKADGSFSMNGVPVSSKPYKIAATCSQNGNMYNTSSKSVNMTNSLLVSGVALSLEEVKGNTYTITGYVKGSDNTGIASVTVMASDETNLFVGITDSEGKFSIKVNDEIPYFVSVVGATNETKSVYVSKTSVSPSGEDLVFTIINTPPDPSYGTIKGSIRFSSDYIEFCRSTETIPDSGRYLVRLIGSSTANTSYNSSLRANYKASLEKDETEVEFVFDSVPAGTYSIFVDPAENGFLGSIGNITITKGETKNAGAIDVSFVKPVFEAIVDGSNLQINMPYPFIYDSDEMKYYYRKIGSDTSLLKASIISMDKVLFLADENNNDSFLFSSGKYEIVFQNPWSDANTGLSGLLTSSQVIDYTDDSEESNFIGNVLISNVNSGDIDFERIKYCDGIVSGLDSDRYFYYKDINTDTSFHNAGDFTFLYDFSGYSGVMLPDTNSPTLLAYKDNITESSTNNQSIPFLDSGESADNVSVTSLSIISKKYIGVAYSRRINSDTGGVVTDGYEDYYVKVLKYDSTNSSTPFRNPYSGNIFTLSNSTAVSGEEYQIHSIVLAQSPGNEFYIAVQYIKNGNEDSWIKFFKLGESGATECGEYSTVYCDISDFKVLLDGSLYIEIGDNYEIKAAARIKNSAVIEEASLLNRKSCFIDKYGFMYRIDKAANSLIKTASFDGKPIESWTPPTTYGQDYESTPKLEYILGFNEEGSELYVYY